MGMILDKLAYMMETKQLIKEAIQAKGVTVLEGTAFRAYPNLILAINDSGGSVTNSDYVPDGSVIGKIRYLTITKDMIRQAIEAKGVEVPADATFRDYVELIGQITASNPGTGGDGGGTGSGTLVGYSYNGTVLPALPDWDKAVYPYAMIAYDGAYNFHQLFVSSIPLWTKTGSVNASTGTKYLLYSNYTDPSAWSELGGDVVGELGLWTLAPMWANYDYLYEDGTVFLAASEPTPVYE